MSAISDQTRLSISEIDTFSHSAGIQYGEDAAAAVVEIMLWLRYMKSTSHDGHADELIDGARAFVIESVAYIALGLGRAAISAIRGQIDLVLSYTYFRDHPSEWELVRRTGDGFKLKANICRYHEESTPGFKNRLNLIEGHAGYTLNKVYQILSAHIHGQTSLTIPQTNSLNSVVLPSTFVKSIVDLQRETSIAVSNFLTAVYAHHWPEIPNEIIGRVKATLTPPQRPLVFAD